MALIPYFARIQFDFGALALLPEEVALAGMRRPLVVTDRGVVASGIIDRVLDVLAPLRPVPVFDGVPAEPTLAVVEQALARYRTEGCDGVVAVGGGVSIDSAKAVALLATHPAPLDQYEASVGGTARITNKVAPLVAVPTTAGTGSDIGRGMGIALREGDAKGVFASPHLIPKASICDPQLTLTLPPKVTAGTGVDAFSHCFEAFLSKALNPPVDAIALDGMARLTQHLETAVNDGGNRAARWQVMMGATEGGMCFWKGLGAAHALSIPLDTLGLHHGTLVGVLHPHVLRFVAPVLETEKLERLRVALRLPASADVADAIEDWNRRIGLPAGLREMGVRDAMLPDVAAQAAASFFNQSSPRSGTTADYLALLRQAMG